MFLLVPAHPGSPGLIAVKWVLLYIGGGKSHSGRTRMGLGAVPQCFPWHGMALVRVWDEAP